jgi:hypothetical protein
LFPIASCDKRCREVARLTLILATAVCLAGGASRRTAPAQASGAIHAYDIRDAAHPRRVAGPLGIGRGTDLIGAAGGHLFARLGGSIEAFDLSPSGEVNHRTELDLDSWSATAGGGLGYVLTDGGDTTWILRAPTSGG